MDFVCDGQGAQQVCNEAKCACMMFSDSFVRLSIGCYAETIFNQSRYYMRLTSRPIAGTAQGGSQVTNLEMLSCALLSAYLASDWPQYRY